ncbi:dispersed gene family protein 1 (DGF-1) [Trypanosoma cruzi]|nr:dispersed gene family protein 1 (DGF-1) [Trypanosoma cruzi]
MLTCASKKGRLDYWRAAISPPLFRATITAFLDALDGCRLQRRHVGVSWPCASFTALGLLCGRNIWLQERCQWPFVFFLGSYWSAWWLCGAAWAVGGRWYHWRYGVCASFCRCLCFGGDCL